MCYYEIIFNSSSNDDRLSTSEFNMSGNLLLNIRKGIHIRILMLNGL